MKRLAFLHGDMIIGGSEKVMLNMLEKIDFTKYEVDLFLPNDHGGFFSKIPPKVNIVFWPSEDENRGFARLATEHLRHGRLGALIRMAYYRLHGTMFKKNWFIATTSFYKSLPKLSDKKYDAVFVYDDKSQRDIYFISHRLRYKKRISWIHSSFQEEVSRDFYVPKEYRENDWFFCVSDSVRKNLEKYFPFVQGKTQVFYNLIDTGEIRRKSEEAITEPFGFPTIVSVGRLSEEKGQTMIPETSRLLLDAGISHRWYVIGEGYTRPWIEERIRGFGVEENVILLGEKTNPYPYIKSADIFVQPSFFEGYCTTTVEAKVLGRPVVTTDAPGMREQFKSMDNGIIVEEMTPASLADGIKRMIVDPKLRERISKTVLEHDESNVGELKKLDELFKKA